MRIWTPRPTVLRPRLGGLRASLAHDQFLGLLLGVLLVLMLSTDASIASASPSARGSSSTEANTKKAQALHREAVQAAKDGFYRKAKTLWQSAHSLDPDPKYLFNLGLVAEESEQPVEALELFERYLREAHPSGHHLDLAPKARKRIRTLMQRVAVLEIEAPQAGAQVHVDQRALGKGPLRATLRLSQGKHLVVATLAGHHGETHTLELFGGQRRQLLVTLRKIQPKVVRQKARMRYPMPRWLPWTLLGTGLAVGLASVPPLALYGGYYDRYNDSVARDPLNPDELLRHTGDRMRAAGIALIVVGGALAAGGLLAVLLNRPRLIHEPTPETGPSPPRESAEVGKPTGASTGADPGNGAGALAVAPWGVSVSWRALLVPRIEGGGLTWRW